MNNNQVLTSLQCRELRILGLDMSDAHLYHHKLFWSGDYHDTFLVESPSPLQVPGWHDSVTPTYSLQDILENKLPKGYRMTAGQRGFTIQLEGNLHQEADQSLLECAFRMLRWCLENEKIYKV